MERFLVLTSGFNYSTISNTQIKLETVVNCTDGVEIWLGRLLEEMKSSMQEVLAKIAAELSDPEFDFIKDFQDYCGQVHTRVKTKQCANCYVNSSPRLVSLVYKFCGQTKPNLRSRRAKSIRE